MSNTQHTPGPWKTWPSINNGQTYIVRGDYTIRDLGSIAHATTEDDARLIAAAPDLLALLIKLVDTEGPQPGTSAWGDEVRAAIAKATGEGLQ